MIFLLESSNGGRGKGVATGWRKIGQIYESSFPRRRDGRPISGWVIKRSLINKETRDRFHGLLWEYIEWLDGWMASWQADDDWPMGTGTVVQCFPWPINCRHRCRANIRQQWNNRATALSQHCFEGLLSSICCQKLFSFEVSHLNLSTIKVWNSFSTN